MKILFKVMLAFMVVICAAGALVFILHFNNGGNTDNAQLSERRTGSNASDVSDNATIVYASDDERVLQRAIERPAGSIYWHLYPNIPEDALPGDTVVLSAVARGFVDWEIDENQTDLKIVDKTSDGEQVYISFIMPDEDVVIRALYDDMLFQYTEPHETIVLPMTTFSTTATPDNMPVGMVGVAYSVELNLMDVLPPLIPWVGEIDPATLPAPTGWDYNPVTRSMENDDPVAGTFTFRLVFNDSTPDLEPGTEAPPEFVTLSITILPVPIIDPPSFPDGMVNVPYNASMSASGAAMTESSWEWSATGLPLGLTMGPTGVISGTPTVQSAASPFTVTITPSNPFFTSVTATFTFNRIWVQPVISATTVVLEDNILLPGMEGQLYNPNAFGVSPNPTVHFTVSNIPTVGTWIWVPDGLPDGLTISWNSADLSEAWVRGSTLDIGTFDFSVLFTLDPNIPNHPIIGRSAPEEFEITILPLPSFETTSADLTVGMQGPQNISAEPYDEKYETYINATGFPAGTTWEWDVVGLRLPPYDPEVDPVPPPLPPLPDGLSFLPVPGTGNLPIVPGSVILDISGYVGYGATGKNFGTFPFTVVFTCTNTNENIKGAEIERDFVINIWRRTYLNITMTRGTGFVIRDGEIVDWEDPRESDIREFKRAVWPGTVGEIQYLSNGGFVRWELESGRHTSGGTVSTNAPVNIGGEGNYGILDDGITSYVRIRMPDDKQGMPFDDDGIDWNVYLRGIPRVQPNMRGPTNPGVVGNPDFDGTLSVDFDDVGEGPRQLRWDSIGGDWPPGLNIAHTAGFVTRIGGTPTRADTYRFRIGLTLPGSMVIERDFQIVVLPYQGFGDVNNDGVVDLRDLVALMKFFEGDRTVTVNFENANLTGKPGPPFGPPLMQDLTALRRYFATGSFTE